MFIWLNKFLIYLDILKIFLIFKFKIQLKINIVKYFFIDTTDGQTMINI